MGEVLLAHSAFKDLEQRHHFLFGKTSHPTCDDSAARKATFDVGSGVDGSFNLNRHAEVDQALSEIPEGLFFALDDFKEKSASPTGVLGVSNPRQIKPPSRPEPARCCVFRNEIFNVNRSRSSFLNFSAEGKWILLLLALATWRKENCQ